MTNRPQLNFYALTDSGQVRTNNEDAFAFDEPSGVAVLADGMGGYNAGEVASGMATAFVHSELVKWMSSSSNSPSVDQMTKAIGLCVSKANRSILQAAVSNPQYAGMGTTLVVGIFKNEHLVLGHVGDSRCYRLRDGLLVQITKDHSLLQERVDAGLLTPAQAAVAPGKNLLTRALGVEDVVNVELHEHRIESNDLYLLCTDGLTDMVSDQSITRTMGSAVTLAKMAESLVAQANANGGRDNITALLVQVKTLQAKPSLMSRFLGKTVNSVLD